jgi:hypothetical protein
MKFKDALAAFSDVAREKATDGQIESLKHRMREAAMKGYKSLELGEIPKNLDEKRIHSWLKEEGFSISNFANQFIIYWE